MNQDAPIDQGLFDQNTLTAQEIIQRLQANGYYEVYETDQGSVEINGINALKCRIVKNSNGSWTPVVNIEWISVYVIVPAIIFKIVAGFLGFKIGGFMLPILLGYGVGTLVIQNKKKTTYAHLEEIISA